MSVRQDKKSRKLNRDIDKHMRVIQRKIKADNEKFTPMSMDLYIESLRKLSIDEEYMFTTFEKDPNGTDAHSPGAKLDSGKNRLGLVIGGFANALQAVGEIGTGGAIKYTPNGWKDVPDGLNRYTDAMYRHLLYEAGGELYDDDTGKLHASHAAWNALARLEFLLRDDDDAVTDAIDDDDAVTDAIDDDDAVTDAIDDDRTRIAERFIKEHETDAIDYDYITMLSLPEVYRRLVAGRYGPVSHIDKESGNKIHPSQVCDRSTGVNLRVTIGAMHRNDGYDLLFEWMDDTYFELPE